MVVPQTARLDKEKQAPSGSRRAPLSRTEILETSLKIADDDGFEALTMRQLAQELGVDAMAVHRHVGGRDGLLDGLVEAMWSEITLPPKNAGWEQALRAMAESMRALAQAHPNVYGLLCTRWVMPQSALELCDDVLKRLEGAGFSRDVSGEAVRSVFAYAMGYAVTELGLLVPQSGESGQAPSDIEMLVRIMQAVPRDTPPRLIEVAATICNCDMDRQFTFGLDLMLSGLASQKGARGRKVDSKA
jgi:AcrR family transcriptional regulator